ncbi:MAG TPA: response regulator [Candidatus Dormibacteraeota bacterium]|nr:response regulator [Candidatus Dormibacteraeota bacterium]
MVTMATVLFADDDADIRVLASELLGRHGHRVVTAGDGTEAISLLADFVPDMVITDLNMPHQDGHAVCRAVRKMPHLSTIPLVLITALPEDDQRVLQIAAESQAIVIAKTDIVNLPELADQLVSTAAA